MLWGISSSFDATFEQYNSFYNFHHVLSVFFLFNIWKILSVSTLYNFVLVSILKHLIIKLCLFSLLVPIVYFIFWILNLKNHFFYISLLSYCFTVFSNIVCSHFKAYLLPSFIFFFSDSLLFSAILMRK